MTIVRRGRGLLLRAARRRPTAFLLGVLFAAPAAWLELSGRFDAWWVDGLALVFGATGVALIWAGITGARPDWIDQGGRGSGT